MGEDRKVLLFGVDLAAKVNAPQMAMAGVNSSSNEVSMGAETPVLVSTPILCEAVPKPVKRTFSFQRMIVQPGQDIIVELLAMSRQDSRAIQIFSADGMVSHVRILLTDHSGSVVSSDLQGMFPIIALEGIFLPTGDVRGLSISISNDGQATEGLVVGKLVAGTRVQLDVGSISPDGHWEASPEIQEADCNTLAQNASSFSSPIPTCLAKSNQTWQNLSGPA